MHREGVQKCAKERRLNDPRCRRRPAAAQTKSSADRNADHRDAPRRRSPGSLAGGNRFYCAVLITGGAMRFAYCALQAAATAAAQGAGVASGLPFSAIQAL
jgi:hypothetical protein